MRPTSLTVNEALSAIERIDQKYRPVWERRSPDEKVALARYFLPHSSDKPVLGPTRPRIIKWYCPFAAQRDFPTGHRYCINVYTGCSHKCVYCYVCGYQLAQAAIKKNFQALIAKDMEDLQYHHVPPAPVHLSNSTDPFQPLETEFAHTQYALAQILAHRQHFTTVTILTKNPLLAAQPQYLELFQGLAELPAGHPRYEDFSRKKQPGFVIEVSLAFWREAVRKVYDPCAPTVEERIEGIRLLHRAGIPLVLRIDPLFPCPAIGDEPGPTLADFGLPEAQTTEDIENLVGFAKSVNARHVVYSPAKIVRPRGRSLSGPMRTLKEAYEALAAPHKLTWRGGSWRLPQDIAEVRVLRPFLETCRRHGVMAKYCKQNLIETP